MRELYNNAVKVIGREEGWSPVPYYCTEGYPTIGYGFKIGGKGDPLPSMSIPIEAGDAWLNSLVRGTYRECKHLIPADLSDDRKVIIISMAYQMGAYRLSKFKKTLSFIASGDFKDASEEMLNSLWCSQSENRAIRHAIVMRDNNLKKTYPGLDLTGTMEHKY